MALIWQGRTKPSGVSNFLLKEDAFNLLLETGDKIVLARGEEWTKRLKPTGDN